MPAVNPPLDIEPVAVIGGGPVGQTAALLLARWGVPSVLLESMPRRELIGSKAICQQRDVIDIWDTVGAGGRIAEQGVTWSRARTYFRDRELFTVEFQDRGRSPFPPWVNLSQARVEEILDELIEEDPLIEVRWNHEVHNIVQDETDVVLTCEVGDDVITVSAPYVIACAGLGASALRRVLGVSYQGESFDDQFLICDIRADLPDWEDERRFFFDPEWNPGRQVLIHHCPDSTFRIDWQVPDDFDLAEEERSGALEARIRKIVGDRDYEIVWKSVYRFHSRHVDRMRVGKALIAGDMAHVMSPFGARGLNSGVQDVENAAWKLAFVLRGWAPETLLESYNSERLAAALENLDVTTRTMRFLVPQTPDERDRRQTVLERALSDPAARRKVDSGRLAEPFWYTDSPLTTPNPNRPKPERPAPGQPVPPGPGAILPDIEVSAGRLRELAREGISALTDGVDPDDVADRIRAVTAAPSSAYAMASLNEDLAGMLDARPGEVWLVRPDAHVAAVVETGEVERAVRRILALEARV